MPKRQQGAHKAPVYAGASPAEQRALIYNLSPAVKRQKKEDPLDISLQEAAAKKSAKTNDAQELKKLGQNPAGQLRAPGARTGLRNLGATCYMNSLLQCLYMNHAFRAGIYSWKSTLPPRPPAAPSAKAGVTAAAGSAASAADGTDGNDEGGGDGTKGDGTKGDSAIDVDAEEEPPRPPEEVAEEVCRQLQALFAHLQHSELACYDPAALTSALSLNTSVQQDAQEVRLRAAPPLKPHFAQPIPLLAPPSLPPSPSSVFNTRILSPFPFTTRPPAHPRPRLYSSTSSYSPTSRSSSSCRPSPRCARSSRRPSAASRPTTRSA